MKQERSPNKPNSEGYIRVCTDCGNDMHWEWGGRITYFKCVSCSRIEPCANLIIDRRNNSVTLENGNKQQVFAYSPQDFHKVLEACLTKPS